MGYHANHEPPQVVNQAAVKENCPDWTLRVLRALQSTNIVPIDRIKGVEALLDCLEDGRRNSG